MKDQIKKFLNEDQDPKAIEKITSKLSDLLMKNEEIGYIGVQKKPALTVFPDSIVLTNKRIIFCKPKNLGLSMDFSDYPWSLVGATFVKENIFGSEFSFTTSTDLTLSIDYLPKTQARKIYTFAKEQIELLKEANNPAKADPIAPIAALAAEEDDEVARTPLPLNLTEEVEEVETEEVNDFGQIMTSGIQPNSQYSEAAPAEEKQSAKLGLADLSKEELFDKLQSYKKLLDNGLILQGEYDTLKKEILSHL
jgi:hypothetical protein